QFEAAATCYLRAHRLDPQSFRWAYYLGWQRAADGRHAEAVAALRDALQRDRDYLPARLKLAESLFAAGRLDESREEYEAIRRQHPDSAPAHYGLGRVHAA